MTWGHYGKKSSRFKGVVTRGFAGAGAVLVPSRGRIFFTNRLRKTILTPSIHRCGPRLRQMHGGELTSSSSMKITKVKTHVLSTPLDEPFAFSMGWVTKRSTM